MVLLCKKSFSLVENMVVVIILGVLAAAALPQYSSVLDKGKAAEAISALDSVRMAQLVYKAETNTYAADINDLDVTVSLSNSSIYSLVQANNTFFAVCPGDIAPGLTPIGRAVADLDPDSSKHFILYIYEDGTFICRRNNCSSDICSKIGFSVGISP